MKHQITEVKKGSIAEELGIVPGEFLVAFDEKPVDDILDYEYYDSQEHFSMTIIDRYNEAVIFDIEKYEDEHLGLSFGDEMIKTRLCQNNCIFCFVDQLPAGMRKTVYVKDDDWRLSFMMGNFVTLTNLRERDMQRILNDKISPLYISVHTTDPELRIKMLRNKKAGEIMNQLNTFAAAGIDFHAQAVLCPDINDGAILRKTFEDLLVLYPHCKSLAVVPVGLTYHRRGLAQLKRVNSGIAAFIIDEIEAWQKKCLELKGTRFVYASDEFYVIAGRDVPKYECYEDFPQLGNGVGMLAKMEHELDEALQTGPEWVHDRTCSIACGTGVAAFINKLCKKITNRYSNVNVKVYPIVNYFFGESVTVTGLLTCRDIAVQLEGKDLGDELLISSSMLRDGDTFLDNYKVANLEGWINRRVTPTENDGEDFLYKVLGVEHEQL